MTRVAVALVSSLLGLAPLFVGGAGCDGDGEFDPDARDDAGPGEPGPPPVGAPCSYAYDGVNPTNDCPSGQTCFIFTGDGAFTTGLALSTWEDQTTVYGEELDEGFCTFVGTIAQPPTCPAGSALKVFSTDVTACLPLCNDASDCGRDGYTCDVRYMDVVDGQGNPLPTCVKKCSFDMPDCVRSGIFAVQGENGQPQLFPMLSFEDMRGASQCDETLGICALITQRGTAGPGEPCTSTEQCEDGSICIQGAILSAVLQPFNSLDPDGPGFCASACTPVTPEQDPSQQANCSTGYVCQEAGNLTLGFPQMILTDGVSVIESRAGFCFHGCALGVEAACDPFPGTQCGSFDENAAGAGWNGEPMCLPASLTP